MSSEFPNSQADLCVKCGMCAPHCPTYSLDQQEPESPRGRIAIMAGIAQGLIEPTARSQTHLDHCLGCQACEAICPAQVPYLDILDQHRSKHQINTTTPDRFIRSIVGLDLVRPWLRFGLKIIAALRQPLMLLSQTFKLKQAHRLLSLVPSKTSWAQARRLPRPQLQLFVGCLGDLANAGAINGFVQCCKALDLRVDVIPAQHCCGALAQHRGDATAAQKDSTKLSRKLRDDIPVVGLDSACVQQLRSSGWPEALDVCAFLAAQDLTGLKLSSPNSKVLLHQPCSHRNGLAQPNAARRLLSLTLPSLELIDTSNPLCCGAAGLHMLDFPERADALLQAKLDDCQDVDIVVSTNVGCALHLAAGLRRQAGSSPAKVYHPVELIAQALT